MTQKIQLVIFPESPQKGSGTLRLERETSKLGLICIEPKYPATVQIQ